MIIKFPFMPDNCIPNAISPEYLSQFSFFSVFWREAGKNYLINEFLGGNYNVNIAKQQSFGMN